MRLRAVGLSNILSFPPSDADLLDFSGVRGGLCILIGPNGCGKSNLLEVLNQFFQKGFNKPYAISDAQAMQQRIHPHSSFSLRQTIVPVGDNEANVRSLERHRDHAGDQQRITLSVDLSDADVRNIDFIRDQWIQLNELAQKYSSNGMPLRTKPVAGEIARTITVRAYLQNSSSWTIEAVGGEPLVQFAVECLTHMAFFRKLIKVRNEYEKDYGEPWPGLPETFAFMGAHRSLSAIGLGTSVSSAPHAAVDEAAKRSLGEGTKFVSGGEPAIFEFVRRRLAYKFLDMVQFQSMDIHAVRVAIIDDPLLRRVNELLKQHLGLIFEVDRPNPYDMNFVFRLRLVADGRLVNPAEMSAGENAILHFIFSLVGGELENGMIVIDEPELHLHPQMQRRFLALMEHAVEAFKMQVIAATHSPAFLTPDSLASVACLRMSATGSEAVQPRVESSERLLFRVLEHENASLIFFASKVVLVEGETDQHFIRALMKQMGSRRTLAWRSAAESIGILNIKGKASLGVWRDLLRKFRIRTFFFGDWDNVREIISLDWNECEAAARDALVAAGKGITKKGSLDGYNLLLSVKRDLSTGDEESRRALHEAFEYVVSRWVPYAKLVAFIRDNRPALWQEICEAIEGGYGGGIFVLREGELEDYLGIEFKGLETVVEFCSTGLEAWLTNPANAAKRCELETIVDAIVTSEA